jgi:prepilin-type N-terminal cleavage/methylation domain-containing protein
MALRANSTCPAVGRSGFSLIELLVATAILGGIIAVTAACLGAGMRLWTSASGYARGEPRIYFALDWMRRDWANAFDFYAVPCKGDSAGMVFPGLSVMPDAPAPGETGIVRRVCQIKYFMDRSSGIFFRKEWLFPEPEPEDARAEPLVRDVERVEFHYRGSSFSDADGGWQEVWNDGSNSPYEVRVRIQAAAESSRGERVERVFRRQVR